MCKVVEILGETHRCEDVFQLKIHSEHGVKIGGSTPTEIIGFDVLLTWDVMHPKDEIELHLCSEYQFDNI